MLDYQLRGKKHRGKPPKRLKISLYKNGIGAGEEL
jgi:hypothetical protein